MRPSTALLLGLLAIGACSLCEATPPRVVQLGLDPNFLPQNLAVLLGEDVVFRCWKNPSSQLNPRIQWSEQAYPNSGGLISDDTFIMPGHPQASRYRIVNEDDPVNQRDLHISSVTVADGGRYACVDGSATGVEIGRATAELVVIDGNQRCTTTIPQDASAVLERQSLAAECITVFKGNLVPFMRWNGPQPFAQIQSATSNTSYSGLQAYADRSMHSGYWQSVANFSTLPPGLPAEGARNIPDFVTSFSTPRITVHWTPAILYVNGMKALDEYLAGDVLDAEVDAFPTASVMWTNLRTSQSFGGTSFTVLEEWVGESQLMRCQAINIINGIQLSADFFVTVHAVPPPTTPTTTLPTTTTPPPAEAPCDLMEGRWESTKPLNAFMCLEIDTSPDALFGNLHGVLRNGTETAWIDLVGSEDLLDHGHVSWTGIWPENRFVATFIGECSKCYGEEILIVSAISRSKGGPVCATPGEILYSQEFEFRRNPSVKCPPITIPDL